MNIRLYKNVSPNNKIGKTLNAELILSGNLRDATSMIKPEVIIEAETLTGYNYAYIPSFKRYYSIKEIESFRTGLWILKMEVDVLETYKTQILALDCIIESTENYKANNYLIESESWRSTVKAKTDIITFSNGLLDNGEYILITAGG